MSGGPPPRTIHPVSGNVANEVPVRFELTCMKRDEFDSFAEQSWTEAQRASGPESTRDEQRSRAASNPPRQWQRF